MNVGRQNISDVTKESLGSVKKWKDIIDFGAVLISDEVITWVPPAPKPKIEENTGDLNTTDKTLNAINNAIDSVTK